MLQKVAVYCSCSAGMLCARATGVFLILFFFQFTDQVEGTTNPCVYTIATDNNGYYSYNVPIGNKQNQLLCCKTGNCTFRSFEDALGNLTSNVVIELNISVVVTANITVENIDNFVMKSYADNTVHFTNTVNIRFVSCRNLTIEGISWRHIGGLQFHNSSNITIQSCYFHNSTRQAIQITGMQGDVKIKDCQFKHNVQYSGNGSAIHYSSGTVNNPPSVLSIKNCSFTSNGPSGSVVYLVSSSSNVYCSIFLQDSVFSHNQGVPIFVSNTQIQVLGTALFLRNSASNGGGIYSDESIVLFNKCKVQFFYNFATFKGGAFYGSHSNITFHSDSSVQFKNNQASTNYGGAIFSQSRSLMVFANNSLVTFTSNRAGQDGGAIYTTENSDVFFTERSQVTFNNNSARSNGGAIGVYVSSDIEFDDSTIVTFSNNVARSRGGAVYAYKNVHMTFNGIAKVTFVSNTATTQGGAVYFGYSNVIIFNAPVLFQNNSASSGLAVYCGSRSSNLRFKEGLYKAPIHYNSDDGEDLSDTCAVSVEKYTCEYTE